MWTYKLYPTLLNSFVRYGQGLTTEQELIDKINRVPVPQTPAQARGVSFEAAIIKGTDEALYDPEILRKVRELLPRPMVATQVYCEYAVGDVLVYGFLDVLGTNIAVDIKTTGRYAEGRYTHDHQNFYLPALRRRGVRTLRYIITDFSDVYLEEFGLDTDFSVQEGQIREFCHFLDSRRELITDKRIFGIR